MISDQHQQLRYCVISKVLGPRAIRKCHHFLTSDQKAVPFLSYQVIKHASITILVILEGLLKKTMQSLWPLVKVIFYDVILANVILQNKYLPITLGKALLTTAFLSLSSLCCWAMSYVLFFQVTLYDLKVLHKKPDFFLDFLLVK